MLLRMCKACTQTSAEGYGLRILQAGDRKVCEDNRNPIEAEGDRMTYFEQAEVSSVIIPVLSKNNSHTAGMILCVPYSQRCQVWSGTCTTLAACCCVNPAVLRAFLISSILGSGLNIISPCKSLFLCYHTQGVEGLRPPETQSHRMMILSFAILIISLIIDCLLGVIQSGLQPALCFYTTSYCCKRR